MKAFQDLSMTDLIEIEGGVIPVLAVFFLGAYVAGCFAGGYAIGDYLSN